MPLGLPVSAHRQAGPHTRAIRSPRLAAAAPLVSDERRCHPYEGTGADRQRRAHGSRPDALSRLYRETLPQPASRITLSA